MGTVTQITTARDPGPGMYPQLLTPGEVAHIFRVTRAQVTRWANAGKIRSVRTIGGHRRYYEDEVRGLLNGGRP